MIRVIYNLTTKEVSSVLFAQGETLFNQQIFGMLQGDVNTLLSLMTSLGILPDPLIQFCNDNGIDTTLLAQRARVAFKMAKGRSIVNRFIEENEQVTIDTTSNLQMLQSFMPIKTLLETGALTSARDMVINTPDEAFIIVPPYTTSAERKQSYLDELNELLNQLAQ